MATEKRLLDDEEVRYILRNSFLVEEEIRQWYDSFQLDCPDGKLDKEKLIEMHKKFYKKGSPEDFCELLFRVIDKDGNGTIEFMEYLIAFAVMTSSDPNERLKWAFKLFDLNRNNFIEKGEMVNVVKALYEMIGRQSSFDCDDENDDDDFESGVQSAFERLDINHDGHISEDEFIEVCKKVPGLAKVLRIG